MICLRRGPYKKFSEFLPGELAHDKKLGVIYLAVNSSGTSAFRRFFRWKAAERWWVACFGRLERFGHDKEFAMVIIEIRGF